MAKREELKSDEYQEQSETAKTSGGGKKLVLIIFLVLLVLGGAVGAYFSGMFGKKPAQEEASKDEPAKTEGAAPAQAKDKDGKPLPAQSGPIYFNFPENQKFIVNLNTGGKQTSFLKVDVALELPNAQALDAVNANLPRIMDAFNTYLRELRPSDLQGSAGVYRLREELMLRVNKSIYPSKVNDILFKEFVVQ